MNPTIQAKLLQLNRRFYTIVASEFDQTRAGLPVGWDQLMPWLPTVANPPATVLDVGCGNGRFARFLEQIGYPSDYLGIDGEGALLELAAEQTQDLTHVRTNFAQADLASTDWANNRVRERAPFDLIVSMAVLHHLPGRELRQQVLRWMADLLAPDGVLMLSNWQFFTSPRLAGKQISWATIGVQPDEIEPGDALLPWQQGVQAVRYVHQLDEAEINEFAYAAGLTVATHFYADGKNGRLNLYSICRQKT